MTALAPGEVATGLARLRAAHMHQLASFIEEKTMSESGVIPPQEERKPQNPMVRKVGHVADIDGMLLVVGVDHDTVTIGTQTRTRRFTRHQLEEFAHLFVAACWEAGENKRRMDSEAVPP